jgi:hypothetical protein
MISLVFIPYKMLLGLSRKRPWTGNVACIGKREIYTGICLGNLKERDAWKN